MTAPNHDPRAGEAATAYIRILNEIQALGTRGFALMLDTADELELTRLLNAARIIQTSIDRTKPLL